MRPGAILGSSIGLAIKKFMFGAWSTERKKFCFYFFDKPEEGTRSREVLTQFIGDAKVKSL